MDDVHAAINGAIDRIREEEAELDRQVAEAVRRDRW
jgi:hypothetical protein